MRLRDVAARTVPFMPMSKKHTPPEIMDALEAIVRPFYMDCEAGPQINKCKAAIRALLFPILAPWVAERTTLNKMQDINKRLCGLLEHNKNEFRTVARSCGELSRHFLCLSWGCRRAHTRKPRVLRMLPFRVELCTALLMFLS